MCNEEHQQLEDLHKPVAQNFPNDQWCDITDPCLGWRSIQSARRIDELEHMSPIQ